MKCSFCGKEATRVVPHTSIPDEFICECQEDFAISGHAFCISIDEYTLLKLIKQDKGLFRLCPVWVNNRKFNKAIIDDFNKVFKDIVKP